MRENNILLRQKVISTCVAFHKVGELCWFSPSITCVSIGRKSGTFEANCFGSVSFPSPVLPLSIHLAPCNYCVILFFLSYLFIFVDSHQRTKNISPPDQAGCSTNEHARSDLFWRPVHKPMNFPAPWLSIKNK